jgi:hypothetical protein
VTRPCWWRWGDSKSGPPPEVVPGSGCAGRLTCSDRSCPLHSPTCRPRVYPVCTAGSWPHRSDTSRRSGPPRQLMGSIGLRLRLPPSEHGQPPQDSASQPVAPAQGIADVVAREDSYGYVAASPLRPPTCRRLLRRREICSRIARPTRCSVLASSDSCDAQPQRAHRGRGRGHPPDCIPWRPARIGYARSPADPTSRLPRDDPR